MRTVWQKIEGFGMRHTFAVGVAVATVRTGAADLCTQRYIERRRNLDLPRLMCFTLLGFLWNGCLQQVVYVNVFAKTFPHAATFAALPTVAARLRHHLGLRDLVGQTAVVNLAWCPLFLHFFYPFQEFIQGVSSKGPDDSKEPCTIGVTLDAGFQAVQTNFWVALDRCHRNLWTDMQGIWAIWIPGHMVTFAVPMWLRMPLTHLLSFVYFVLLSVTRGNIE